MPASVNRGFAFSNLMDLTIRLNTRLILSERSAMGAFNQRRVGTLCRNDLKNFDSSVRLKTSRPCYKRDKKASSRKLSGYSTI